MVGEQFKRNNQMFDFNIIRERCKQARAVTNQELKEGVITNNMDGLRLEIVRWNGKSFLVDAWQHAIVTNAHPNSIFCDGNLAGDDFVKERGLKYVVTGDCSSDAIQIANIGEFDARESLLFWYKNQIQAVFEQNGYMIGNAILYPQGICHSFVLLDWTVNDEILLYDPWDGNFHFFTVSDVFDKGFHTILGTGVIKWLQYIM